jgi:hypothetical protein
MGKDVIINKIDQNDDELVLSVEKGGTGSDNQASAMQTLGYISIDKLNVANGVAGLDSNACVKLEQLPIDLARLSISINGPKQVIINSANTYNIIAYSSFNNYTVSASAGTISRNGAIITLVAPSTPQIITLTINGKSFSIDVAPATAHVNTPSITSPVTGATNLGPDIAITSSTFSVNGGSDTHEGTDWQIATDASFTNIVASVINSTTDKLSWVVQGLLPATQYFIRTRYKGITMGYSNWSATNTLTTKANYLPTTEEAILTASDKAANDYFGYSVAISSDGSRCIVGAYNADPDGITDAGKAYIFTRSGTTWTQEAILTASDKAANDQFGYSAAISSDGSRCIVGAYYADPSGVANAGKAYIFARSGTTWTQEAMLSASDKTTSDGFGRSVAISSDGSRCTVGTDGADPSGLTNAGKAYIFARSGTTWTQEAILSASDKAANDGFGRSVAISSDGSRCTVGADGADPSGITDAGKAYIFTRSGTTWTQEAMLSASDKAANDYFGRSVAISSDGSRCIVGAHGADPSGLTNAGKAYIFARSGTTWTQEAVLMANDKAANDQFGCSVAISSDGTGCIVGSQYADPSGITNAGKAYIFS